jgi:hypothetical protein
LTFLLISQFSGSQIILELEPLDWWAGNVFWIAISGILFAVSLLLLLYARWLLADSIFDSEFAILKRSGVGEFTRAYFGNLSSGTLQKRDMVFLVSKLNYFTPLSLVHVLAIGGSILDQELVMLKRSTLGEPILKIFCG